jgi:glycosyltransferase involved in cell wall biosynthesis
MILLDAIFINNSGGKILLDYLIEQLEEKNLQIVYLLDERIREKHVAIKNNKIIYLKPSFLTRYNFYKKYKNSFSSVLCFGNLPPFFSLNATVYTYFHNTLLLEVPHTFSLKGKILLKLKSFILKYYRSNTNFWLVQTEVIKDKILKHKITKNSDNVLLMPFYPSFGKLHKETDINNHVFAYISHGNPQKNHYNLLKAFKRFYDNEKKGILYLTVGSEFPELHIYIHKLIQEGYPIINHGLIDREKIKEIYSKVNYIIYPSLTESFGLSIIEAIENDCKVIGADLPYMHAVCEPSLVFNPNSIDSIYNSFKFACDTSLKPTKQLVFNEINKLIQCLK